MHVIIPMEVNGIFRCQVMCEPDVTRALDLARAEFGSSPFVAVNCAGIGYAKRTISRYVLTVVKNPPLYSVISFRARTFSTAWVSPSTLATCFSAVSLKQDIRDL